MFIDGFKYWLAFQKDGKSYYRCRRHKKGCPAKIWVPDTDPGQKSTTPKPSVEHNHGPETERALVDNFRKVLTRRAATEKQDLHSIYVDEATTRHSEAALNYPFSPTAESAMAKARRKAASNTTFPDVVDLDKIGEILKTSSSFRILDYGQRDLFYQEAISRGGITALLFAHHATLDKLTKPINEVQVNVTTLICSSGNYSLLTVHRLAKTEKVIPLVYVILNGQTTDIYSAIFAHLREKLNIVPSVIISDCLLDLHSCLLLAYPEASLKANWFEYVTSVSNHLATAPRETFKDANHQIILRMILVLPFLPADYMAPGLEAIRKWMRDKGIDITAGPLGTLCRHVETAWMRGIGAGRLSMFRVSISVDHMKEFHEELNLIIGTTTPSIWNVINGLTAMAGKINTRLNRAAASMPAKEKEKQQPRKKSQILAETIVRSATEQWITQPIHLRSPLQFLQMASHFITIPFLAVVLRQRDLPGAVHKKAAKRPHAKAKDKPGPPAKAQPPVTEPPPLLFFPKVVPTPSPVIPREPPPLVPISASAPK